MSKIITPIDDSKFSMICLREAEQLAHDNPAALTDRHLAHCAVYDRQMAAQWQLKRERAIAKAAAKAAAPPPRPTLPEDVARLPKFTKDDLHETFSTEDGFEVWVEKNVLAAVPVGIWAGFVTAARVKRQALEARVAELEAKVREMDTQRTLLAGDTKHLDTDPVRLQ